MDMLRRKETTKCLYAEELARTLTKHRPSKLKEDDEDTPKTPGVKRYKEM